MDLTSMRLMESAGEPSHGASAWSGASARSAASASGPHPPYADEEEERPRGMPLLAFALAGTTLGLVIGLVVWLANILPFGRDTPTVTPTPSTSSSGSSSQMRFSADLIPRNVRITNDDGPTIVVQWDYPVKTPDSYVISVKQGRTNGANLPGPPPVRHPGRSRAVAVDPKARPICIIVTGVKTPELGSADQVCTR